jgi:hypothetical protein
MQDTAKISFRREFDALTTLRDELRLKAHLAKSDVKDELNRLEAKWQRLDEDFRRSATHMKEPLESLALATKDLYLELKQGYERVKRDLS